MKRTPTTPKQIQTLTSPVQERIPAKNKHTNLVAILNPAAISPTYPDILPSEFSDVQRRHAFTAVQVRPHVHLILYQPPASPAAHPPADLCARLSANRFSSPLAGISHVDFVSFHLQAARLCIRLSACLLLVRLTPPSSFLTHPPAFCGTTRPPACFCRPPKIHNHTDQHARLLISMKTNPPDLEAHEFCTMRD